MDDPVHVHADELLVGPQAREMLDPAHRLGTVQRGPLDDIERASQELGVLRVLLHELGVAKDRLEGVVEVVRDAARELPEGSELLGLALLSFDLALGGNVADDRDQPLEPTVAPVESRQRHRQLHRPRLPGGRLRFESVHRRAVGETAPGVVVVTAREQVGDRPADRLLGAEAEDARGGWIPALDAVLRRDRDDGVAGGGDDLLLRALLVGDLAVEAGISQCDRQVLGEHLE